MKLNDTTTYLSLALRSLEVSVAPNLHCGAVTDIRVTSFELGFNPMFMKMVLDCTSARPRSNPV